MRKLLALLLALVMLAGLCSAGSAETYGSLAMNILETINEGCSTASNDEERKAICAYGAVYLLSCLANQIDADARGTTAIEDVMRVLEEEDAKASSCEMQLVNAFNRMAEMCGGLAVIADADNSNREMIQKNYTSFVEYLEEAENNTDLMANGAYRSVEFLMVVAAELNDGSYSDFIMTVYNEYAEDDARCAGYKQQLVNGVYSCAKILSVIACEVDADESCRDLIQLAIDEMWAQDEAAANADGQIIAGLRGMSELIAITCLDLDGEL